MKQQEILKRISELNGKMSDLIAKPKRFRYFNHEEKIAKYEGEIAGLQWVIRYWDGYYETERIEQLTDVTD